jgi:hypothetical protein
VLFRELVLGVYSCTSQNLERFCSICEISYRAKSKPIAHIVCIFKK